MSRKVRQYVYADEHGRPRFRKVRSDPKRMPVETWKPTLNGRGGWVPKLRDDQLEFSERAMYHLQELIWALRANEPVFWCEGEKDADALRGVGAFATSHWQGASDVHPSQARWFAEFGTVSRVYVVVDVDDPGAYCGLLRYKLLRRAGVDPARLRIVAPPRPHNDAAEAVEAGALRADLRALGLRRVTRARLRAASDRYLAAGHARNRSYTRQSAS
jgi:hypothetical protein